ncbi:MAG: hypothetical protein ACK5LN_08195 [Propioniciclava sp.]
MLGRRTLVGSVLACGAATLTAGCQTTPAQPAGPLRPGEVAAGLRESLEAGRERFLDCFTASGTPMGRAWFDTWTSLQSVVLAEREPGVLDVATQVGSEEVPARVTLNLHQEGGRISSATADGPEPIWFRVPAQAYARGEVAVLIARGGAESEEWLGAASRAADRLAELLPDHPGHPSLVVEVPVDMHSFVRRYHGEVNPSTAAFTDVREDSGPRIVLNPEAVEAFATADRFGLLTHEGMHAVLSSPLSRAPLALVEGLAEWAALPVWPAAHQANARALVAAEATSLPSREDFTGDQAQVASAYARSEVLVAGCVRRWGIAAVVSWIRPGGEPVPDDAVLLEVYREELSRR